MSIRAAVIGGRLIVDQATSLPEGTVLDLVLDDEGDDLDLNERRKLDAALDDGLDEAARGETRHAKEILDELRRLR
jgi:hypothetical protein